MKLLILFLGVLLSATSLAASQPHFEKVVLIVFENTDYEAALKSPILGTIAKQGALFTNFLAETHPSQGNYIAMIAGNTFGIHNDNMINLKESHIGDLLEAKSRDWHVYAEDYPENCFTGPTAGLFARKHVPFLSFTNVTSQPDRCAKITNSKSLISDLQKNHIADFNMIVPNLVHDGHNGGLPKVEEWMKANLMPLLNDAQVMSSTLFIFTFDESESKGVNHIFTAMIGARIQPGTEISQEFNHADIIGLIQNEWGLESLPKQMQPKIISGVW